MSVMQYACKGVLKCAYLNPKYSGPYGGQSAPDGVSLYGADCTRYDLAGAKSTAQNGAVCCQHEKKRHGCATRSGAADRALHRLASDAERRIWMCMRVQPAPAASTLDSSAPPRFDFQEFKAYVL